MANNLLKGLRPVHPGELWREDIFPALGRPKTEIAKMLGISRQTLYDLLNEKQPVTPAMALRLAKLSGTSAESWLNMQRNYDLAQLKQKMAKELDSIPTLAA